MNDLYCLEFFSYKPKKVKVELEKKTEAAFRTCSTKKVFLELMKYTEYSQKNICAKASF